MISLIRTSTVLVSRALDQANARNIIYQLHRTQSTPNHDYHTLSSYRQLQFIRHKSTKPSNQSSDFISRFMENLKSDLSKNKDLKENIEKFRQETQKLEESEALQKAREKFYKVEEDTMKGSQQVIENVKDTIKESVNQAKQTEIGKKTIEIGEHITKQAKGAVEGLSKQGENLKHTAAFKTVSQATKTVSEELNEAEIIGRGLYKPPEFLMKRAERSDRVVKPVMPNEETVDVELHKDSKWSQSWKAFKNDNPYVNKVFDLKMKYDESDNPVIRVTRTIVDKIGDAFGGMFQKTDLSQVLTEICIVDPSFDINQFLKECETFILPTILESMCQGNMEVLNDWCHEAVFNVLSAPQKQAQQLGHKIYNRILEIENIDLALGKMMEQGPVLVVTFQAQQIIYIKDSKGNIIEGDPDRIIQNSYVMAFCRDQSDLDPATAWRLIDVAMHQSQFSF